jgi:Cu/Zn superoxide dismutase
MSALAKAAAAAVAACLLASCAGPDPKSPAAADQVGNLEARLRGIGSAATGSVVIVDSGDGVTLTLDGAGLPQGTYRLAFHANPVCNSPRGESAGPVWGPPDSARPPGELIPTVYVGMWETVQFSVHVPGVHVDREPSLRGRSVVLHAGPFVDSPFPGLPNNYIACGVFGELKPGLLQNMVK